MEQLHNWVYVSMNTDTVFWTEGFFAFIFVILSSSFKAQVSNISSWYTQ